MSLPAPRTIFFLSFEFLSVIIDALPRQFSWMRTHQKN
ncbi:hypothetical protein BURMUCGD2M_3949 [Burkholderia multivorans CGD2M]|uniref:Uncharacterized protein n=1 Tax=Burkholderia multivorans CGD2 TaxID=513052 RepID=B9BRE3_9BURK|nr:hypothetical protein BURMUCGD2_3961 [Burkholderia multivorans CGD2]EEE11984.1 hypothetical protein BURMUCGD2M_3949 [Burkholderia multivorans CGD2M]